MNDDPNVYEAPLSAQTGERLKELVLRALRLREHMWIAATMWSVPDPGNPEQVLLDRENLLTAPEVGCYICEEPWTPRAEKRRCSGEPKPGVPPLLPGGVR